MPQLLTAADLPPPLRSAPLPWDDLATIGASLRLEAPSTPSRASYVAQLRARAHRAAQRRGWSLSVRFAPHLDAVFITRTR